MFGKYSGFVDSAYAIVTVGIVGLVAWVTLEGRRLRRQLQRIETLRDRNRGERR